MISNLLPKSKNYRQRLLRMALITSPLIGLFSFLPIIILLGTLAETHGVLDQVPISRLPIGISVISIIIFGFWLFNIILWSYQYELHQEGKPFKSWWRYLLSYGVILTFITILVLNDTRERPFEMGLLQFYPIVGSIANNTFILLLINLIVTQYEKAELKLEKAELEISHLISQQEQLKQQIHPHFLFNALGTLQILMKKDLSKAELYLQQLAIFLRTSLSLARENIIPIEEELTFLQSYLQLQKMRFATGLQFEISIPKEVKKKGKLPVFTLQILAENAIKHNAFSEKHPLFIHIVYQPEGLIRVSNNRRQKFKAEASTKLGLENLKKRFKHFTPQVPRIEETDAEYRVYLKVL